mgnify:CR=1 FL=1
MSRIPAAFIRKRGNDERRNWQFLQDLIAEGDALRNQPSVKEELTDLDEEDDEWDVYVSVQGHSRWVTKIRAFLYEMDSSSPTRPTIEDL